MAVSDGVHLLIPFAKCSAAGCGEALAAAPLPNLARLLGALQRADADEGTAESFSAPPERALARAIGLPLADGLIPWAAWAAHQESLPGASAWAWITPCHWRVGRDHLAMAPLSELRLAPEESLALLEVVRPWFAEDGITLLAREPARWLAQGELFARLSTASLDRVEGREIDAWMPHGDNARALRRLQQEMQMLLYTHPLTDARIARGELPVNTFWISGTGPTPAAWPAVVPPVRVLEALRAPALAGDATAWASAWQQLDGQALHEAAAAAEAGQRVQLTLCGERCAATWGPERRGWFEKTKARFRSVPVAAMMDDL